MYRANIETNKKQQLQREQSDCESFRYNSYNQVYIGKRTGKHFMRVHQNQNFDGFPRFSEYCSIRKSNNSRLADKSFNFETPHSSNHINNVENEQYLQPNTSVIHRATSQINPQQYIMKSPFNVDCSAIKPMSPAFQMHHTTNSYINGILKDLSSHQAKKTRQNNNIQSDIILNSPKTYNNDNNQIISFGNQKQIPNNIDFTFVQEMAQVTHCELHKNQQNYRSKQLQPSKFERQKYQQKVLAASEDIFNNQFDFESTQNVENRKDIQYFQNNENMGNKLQLQQLQNHSQNTKINTYQRNIQKQNSNLLYNFYNGKISFLKLINAVQQYETTINMIFQTNQIEAIVKLPSRRIFHCKGFQYPNIPHLYPQKHLQIWLRENFRNPNIYLDDGIKSLQIYSNQVYNIDCNHCFKIMNQMSRMVSICFKVTITNY